METFQNPFTGSTLKFGTVILQYGGRTEKIEKRSEEVREEDLTNAIIKIQRSGAKKIYFITGHGEGHRRQREGRLLAGQEGLEDEGFQVETLNLGSRCQGARRRNGNRDAGPTTPNLSRRKCSS